MLKYILYGVVVITANCFGMDKELPEDLKQDFYQLITTHATK